MNCEFKKPLVSVIVPVYKAEKYLHKCVDSLLAQTMTDFEVLLINDGSPDRSGAICDEYAVKDSRIRVFHKENGGVASARQVGIENVRGEYTIHVDPDDWVEPTMLEELYAKAKEDDADMVICDYLVVSEKNRYYVKSIVAKDNIGCLINLFYNKLHASLCNKLIKKSLYENNGISFIKGLDFREDYSVFYKILFFARRISYLPKAYYNYIIGREGSYTFIKMSDKKQEDCYCLIKDIENFSELYKWDKQILSAFQSLKVGTLGDLVMYGDLGKLKDNMYLFKSIRFIDILKGLNKNNIIIRFVLILYWFKLDLFVKLIKRVQ